VVFLHRLERGRASKSYGIEVARLAGLPPAVLANARDVLARLERYELEVFSDDEKIVTGEELAKAAGVSANPALDKATARAGRRKAAAQVSLFDLVNKKIIEEIRDVDQENLSPGEAKELLRKLRARIM
jgi:DNA mismatch repair protein MutS